MKERKTVKFYARKTVMPTLINSHFVNMCLKLVRCSLSFFSGGKPQMGLLLGAECLVIGNGEDKIMSPIY